MPGSISLHARLFVVTLALGGLSCGDEPEPVAAPSPSAARKKAEAVAPVAAASQVDYAYNPINKRDPFRPSVLESPKGEGSEASGEVRCNEPLCLVDLDELTVV